MRCEGVNAQRIIELGMGMVLSGFASKGYEFLNVDDCWHEANVNDAGELVPSAEAFPNGLEPVIDMVHSLGLKFGP